MNESITTDVHTFIDDLDGGVLVEKIGRALSDVAFGVVEHGKKGNVNVSFDLKQIGNSNQVAIAHKLAYTAPTARGKYSEENTTETPMSVNSGGKLTLFPENQGQMFGKKGEVVNREGAQS